MTNITHRVRYYLCDATAKKAQASTDHLAENLIDEEYESLKTYFPDKEISCIDEVIHDNKQQWKFFFDGASNKKGVGMGFVLMSESGEY